MAKTRRLLEDFFVQCFLSELKDAIKNQVAMFQLKTLVQVVGLALLQESILGAKIIEAKALIRKMFSYVTSTTKSKQSSIGKIPPIKRISTAKMQLGRDKKLCYYCDEKHEQGHKYK